MTIHVVVRRISTHSGLFLCKRQCHAVFSETNCDADQSFNHIGSISFSEYIKSKNCCFKTFGLKSYRATSGAGSETKTVKGIV
jgi:hypothetical protein